MREKYRVRDGTILQLELEDIFTLYSTGAVVVDVDGMNVAFELDEREERPSFDDVDHWLTLGPQAPERFLSGFVSQYYDVLDGRNLVVFSEMRPDFEHEFVGDDGYAEINTWTRDVLGVGEMSFHLDWSDD